MLKWSAPEYEYNPKDISWYWLLVIAVIIIVAISLWQKNFLFAIFMLIAVPVLFFWGRREPRLMELELDNKGLHIDKEFLPYENFEGFAIEEELLFKKKGRLNPYLRLSLPEDDQEKSAIKKHLAGFLPEIEYKGSLVDAISKLLKF